MATTTARSNDPPRRPRYYTKEIWEGLHEDYDETGYVWTVEAEHRTPGFELWGDPDGTVYVRQEEGHKVDVLRLTNGQAYGLLKALARSMEVN